MRSFGHKPTNLLCHPLALRPIRPVDRHPVTAAFHRLPCDIRHRYRRYRPRYLHRPRGRSGNAYGGHAELTAGYFVDDSLMLINVVLYVIN